MNWPTDRRSQCNSNANLALTVLEDGSVVENVGDRYQAASNSSQSGMENVGEQEAESVNINAAANYYFYYCCYNYQLYHFYRRYCNSICLEEGRRLNHYQQAPSVHNKVSSSWHQGTNLTQYCEHRNTTSREHHEMNLQHWNNQPTCSFQGANICIPPAEAGMSKVQTGGKFGTKSKSIRKRKDRDLRIKVLKNNLKKLLKSDKGKRVRSGRNATATSTVVSSWARNADNELRALLLSKRRRARYLRRIF
jgi:hypothetical protein